MQDGKLMCKFKRVCIVPAYHSYNCVYITYTDLNGVPFRSKLYIHIVPRPSFAVSAIFMGVGLEIVWKYYFMTFSAGLG